MRKITFLFIGFFLSLVSFAQTVDFDAIRYWVGDEAGTNRAALIVKWNDDKGRENAWMWGYRWEGTATGLDMITTVALSDPRLLLLRQQTGIYGYTIDGIGFSESPLPISFDFEGAQQDERINFKYKGANTGMGQTTFPKDPLGDIYKAIEEGLETGVIEHPFNEQTYGYAAYDYDYWKCDDEAARWRAGWYDGYWTYYVKDYQTDDFAYSGLGASSRVLANNSVDGWSFSVFSSGVNDMSGDYTPVPLPGQSVSMHDNLLSESKVFYAHGNLNFIHCKDYSFSIYTLSGESVGRLDVNNENSFEPVSLQPGIYILKGNRGQESVEMKLVITNN